MKTDANDKLIGPPPDGVNLRAWFVFFILWLVALTAATRWGLGRIETEAGNSVFGWIICVLAGYAAYMSLCCTFFPFPTTAAVMLVASGPVAAQLGLGGHPVVHVALVATVGALATGIANLNEYHLFVYLLRHGRVARIRETRLYRWAGGWFQTNPFLILFLFSFFPIPVDVIRWLAITARYPRRRFLAAYVLGRWPRYAIWAITALGLDLTTRQIIIFQCVLVVPAVLRILVRAVRRKSGAAPEGRNGAVSDDHETAAVPPPAGLLLPISADSDPR